MYKESNYHDDDDKNDITVDGIINNNNHTTGDEDDQDHSPLIINFVNVDNQIKTTQSNDELMTPDSFFITKHNI